MDRLLKSLRKLSAKERRVAEILIARIIIGDTKDLDLKKLKGFDTVFRIRKGRLRIIYISDKGATTIINVTRRSDTTYDF